MSRDHSFLCTFICGNRPRGNVSRLLGVNGQKMEELLDSRPVRNRTPLASRDTRLNRRGHGT